MTAVTDAVALFRSRWDARFIDAVTVTRQTGRGAFNETTLVYAGATDLVLYTGKALVRPATSTAAEAQFGQELVTGIPLFVFLPHDAYGTEDPELEDTVTVTACTFDASFVATELRVVAYDFDSYKTRTRLVSRLDLGSGYVD